MNPPMLVLFWLREVVGIGTEEMVGVKARRVLGVSPGSVMWRIASSALLRFTMEVHKG